MTTNINNLRPPTPGKPLIKLQKVDSTNTFAANLLKSGKADEGTVILADFQESGKGQGGNKWNCEPGSCILMSLILKPEFLKADKQFYLSMSVSVALSRLTKSIGGDSNIKWPNDILLMGKKVAGILIENTVMNEALYTSVIGIGMNVNQKEFPPDLPDAVSLSMATGKEYDRDEVVNQLFDHIRNSLEPLYAGQLPAIRTEYLNRLYRLNEWSRFSDSSGLFEGRISDVTESGELMVARKNGEIRNYGFREIRFD